MVFHNKSIFKHSRSAEKMDLVYEKTIRLEHKIKSGY